MTTILHTPRSWPAILLPRGVRDPLDLEAARAAGSFAGLRRAVRVQDSQVAIDDPRARNDGVDESGEGNRARSRLVSEVRTLKRFHSDMPAGSCR